MSEYTWKLDEQINLRDSTEQYVYMTELVLICNLIWGRK